MSELKVWCATIQPKMKNACDGAREVYLKADADKVIAEKDAEIARLKEQVSEERSAKVDYKISANDLSDGLEKAYAEIDHHKYKRCLDEAKWCNERHTFNETNEKRTWLHKWHKRWLAIASKFKTNSTINRKEATNAL